MSIMQFSECNSTRVDGRIVVERVKVMSTKEMTVSMLNNCNISEDAWKNILSYIQYVIDEAEDDAFCEKMYQDYLNDPDPHKHDSVTLEEAMEMCGITYEDLQNCD